MASKILEDVLEVIEKTSDISESSLQMLLIEFNVCQLQQAISFFDTIQFSDAGNGIYIV